MRRFFGYWGPQNCEILHLPRPSKSKQHLFVFKKGKRKKKTQRKGTLPTAVKVTLTVFRIKEILNLTMSLLTPQHSRITRVLLAGILTSLYPSASVSQEQDNPHAHGSCKYNRVVCERGR